MPLSPGNTISGRYKIVKLLGEGGFGAVYLAEDARLGNKPVAVKESFGNSPEAQEQFRLEARLLATLNHPSLPRVTDNFVESANGRQFLVMDFVEGDDLNNLVEQTGRPLPERDAARIMLQICEAVAYLHDQKPQPIIHRDIKPTNIKITRNGHAVLVDFGIAKMYHPKKVTVKVAKAVSPYFSPPEQYVSKTDARSDVYALGATLYYLLCAHVPTDALERLTQNVLLVPPARHNRQISPPLERLVLRALDLDPNQRFSNAQEMAVALLACLSGQPLAPAQPAGTSVCPRCGRVNRPGARFCAHDGVRLAAGAAAGAAPAPSPVLTLPPQLRFEVANTFARNDDFQHAIPEYVTCLQDGFTDQAVYHNLGLCYLRVDQFSQARDILARGAKAYPSDPELQIQLARAYLKLNQIDRALGCAGRACQLNPQDAVNFHFYGVVFLDAERYPDAIEQLDHAARLDTTDAFIQVALGKAYFLNDQPQKALAPLKKAIQIQPDLFEPYFFLGLTCRAQKKYQDALAPMQAAVRLEPTSSLAHYFLGQTYLNLDRYDEALAAFQKSAQQNPSDPDPHTQMAVCYALKHRRSDAIQAVQRALSIDPHNQMARELLTKL